MEITVTGLTESVVLTLLFIALLMYVLPLYRVWRSHKQGLAELALAQNEQQVQVMRAQGRKDAATLNMEAEVIDATAVQKSVDIIGKALHNNEGYLRWKWIHDGEHRQLHDLRSDRVWPADSGSRASASRKHKLFKNRSKLSLTRKQPLRRSTKPMRKTPLAKRSPGRGKVDYRDAKAKIRCFRVFGSYCIFKKDVPHVCHGPIDPMHNFPKSTYPWLRYDKLNIMPGCRWLHDYFHAHPKEARRLMLAELAPHDAAKLEAKAGQRR